MDCSPLGSSVHGIFQARILEWVAISFFRVSSWPRDQTWVSGTAKIAQVCLHCRQILYPLSYQGSPLGPENNPLWLDALSSRPTGAAVCHLGSSWSCPCWFVGEGWAPKTLEDPAPIAWLESITGALWLRALHVDRSGQSGHCQSFLPVTLTESAPWPVLCWGLLKLDLGSLMIADTRMWREPSLPSVANRELRSHGQRQHLP